jgi:hypothetical protein
MMVDCCMLIVCLQATAHQAAEAQQPVVEAQQ